MKMPLLDHKSICLFADRCYTILSH